MICTKHDASSSVIRTYIMAPAASSTLEQRLADVEAELKNLKVSHDRALKTLTWTRFEMARMRKFANIPEPMTREERATGAAESTESKEKSNGARFNGTSQHK